MLVVPRLTVYTFSSTTGLTSAENILIEGCSNTYNNGYFQVESVNTGASTITVYNNIGIAETPGAATATAVANVEALWVDNCQTYEWAGTYSYQWNLGSPITAYFANSRGHGSTKGVFLNGGTSLGLYNTYFLSCSKIAYDISDSSYHGLISTAGDSNGGTYLIRNGTNGMGLFSVGSEAGVPLSLTITNSVISSNIVTATYSGVDHSNDWYNGITVVVPTTTTGGIPAGRYMVTSMASNTIVFNLQASAVPQTASNYSGSDSGTMSVWSGDNYIIAGCTNVTVYASKATNPSSAAMSAGVVTNSTRCGFNDCNFNQGPAANPWTYACWSYGNTAGAGAFCDNTSIPSASLMAGIWLKSQTKQTLSIGAHAPATSGSNTAGQSLQFGCNVWNGSASESPYFSVQAAPGTGTNPTVDLQFTFSANGSSANPQVQFLMPSSSGNGWNIQYLNENSATSGQNYSGAGFESVGASWTGSTSQGEGYILKTMCNMSSGANPPSYFVVSHYEGTTGAHGLVTDADSIIAWSSADPCMVSGNFTGTVDTGVSRISAAVVGVGDGTQGDYSGTLKAANVIVPTALTLSGELIDSLSSAGTNGYILSSTGSAIKWIANTGLTNPMTTLGDIIYGGASGAATRLAGNTTATPEFLTSTGASSAATAPTWTGSTGSGSVVLSASPTLTGSIVHGLSSYTAGISNSASLVISGSYESASSPLTYAQDSWTIQSQIGSGLDGSSTLVFSQSGTSGSPGVYFEVGNASFSGQVALIPAVAATSGGNIAGPSLNIEGNYWNGSASARDVWGWQNTPSTGSNPSTVLALSHSGGSTGAQTVQISYSNATANLKLVQSTAATSSANVNSAKVELQGQYWTGSATAGDDWFIQVVEGSGSNPTSALTISNTGAGGTPSVAIQPAISEVGGQTVTGALGVVGVVYSNLVTGQTSTVANSTVFTTTAAGHYRVSGNIFPTTLSSTAYNMWVEVTVTQSSAAGSLPFACSNEINIQNGDQGTSNFSPQLFYLASGATIGISTVATGTNTSGVYSYNVVIERLA
jgi:hypothetical protein